MPSRSFLFNRPPLNQPPAPVMATPDQNFAASASMPIPGLTGPTASMPQQQLPPMPAAGPTYTQFPHNTSFNDAMTSLINQDATRQYQTSSNMPIPGMGSQPRPGGPPPSMSPTFASAFQPNGPYGLLAQQLAGVGGPNMGIPQQPNPTQTMGLLGPKQPQRMWGGIGGK